MTPTIVLKNGKPFLVTGSPGGSRIITAVLQVITNVIDLELPIAEAVAAPRIHHQWSPDEVAVERGLPPDVIRALEARGHKVREGPPRTSANSILVTPQGFVGAADPRTRGALAAGFWVASPVWPPQDRPRPSPRERTAAPPRGSKFHPPEARCRGI